MSWSDAAVTVTSWTTTIFFYVALLILTPWIIFLLYDILLYTWRSLTFDIPAIGGRARGRRPPSQPPTLTEHADRSGTRTPPVELAEHLVTRAEQVVAGAVKEVAAHSLASGSGSGSGSGTTSGATSTHHQGSEDGDEAGGRSQQQQQQPVLRRKTGQVSRSPG